MQSLNVTKVTLEHFEWLELKLPNYTMVNYNSLREQIQQINKSCPYSHLAYNFNHSTRNPHNRCGDSSFLYCKYKHNSNYSKTSSMFSCKDNPTETEAIFASSWQQSVSSSKVKATPDKVRETIEMLGMEFSDLGKCKSQRNTKDGSKVATTSV